MKMYYMNRILFMASILLTTVGGCKGIDQFTSESTLKIEYVRTYRNSYQSVKQKRERHWLYYNKGRFDKIEDLDGEKFYCIPYYFLQRNDTIFTLLDTPEVNGVAGHVPKIAYSLNRRDTALTIDFNFLCEGDYVFSRYSTFEGEKKISSKKRC